MCAAKDADGARAVDCDDEEEAAPDDVSESDECAEGAGGKADVADAGGRVVIGGEEWYRVLRVLKVRGSGNHEEAWVEWAGRASADGGAYECSWEPVRQLSADMQAAARALRRRRAGKPAVTAVDRAVARREERARAEVATKRATAAAAARAQAAGLERTARGAQRGAKRAAAGEAPVVAPSDVAAKRVRGRREQPDLAGRKRGAVPPADAVGKGGGERRRQREGVSDGVALGSAGGWLHTEVLRYNPLVYAAATTGGMNGLFTRRAVSRGDILCAYDGKRLSQATARDSQSEYVMRMMMRVAKGRNDRIQTAWDGDGFLGGYANYAGLDVSNAMVLDVLPTILDDLGLVNMPTSTALVVVARYDAGPGTELRYDYDHEGERSFRSAMIGRGVPAAALDSAAYTERQWSVADAAFREGAGVVADPAFAFASLASLGVDIGAAEALMAAERE